MNWILFDSHKCRENLLPLTYTRPVADIRIGILTIREKWEKLLGQKFYSLTETYLEEKFRPAPEGSAIYVNGAVVPTAGLLEDIQKLGAMQALYYGNELIAFKTEKKQLNYENLEGIVKGFARVEHKDNLLHLANLWDIFKLNGDALKSDFALLTKGRTSQPLSKTNQVVGNAGDIFLEPGAKVECCIFNTASGPIYIGADAEVMEGSAIRGPFAMGEHAVVKMMAKIYGATTLGPHCKAGGELNNAVMFGYSNKAHDGFLGNSVIGEWCNLGADTNNSNLKNNYGEVEIFNYREGKAADTGLVFCGLFMGDHAKSGINTMFNTGTVVGVSANVFGGDFPPKFIPSFSWGNQRWLRTYELDKALEVAEKMMERRDIKISAADINILKFVFEKDAKYRRN